MSLKHIIMKIEIEKTINYLDFPYELRQILIKDYIESGSQNGSYTYIEMEEESEGPIKEFLKASGAEAEDRIMVKLSW